LRFELWSVTFQLGYIRSGSAIFFRMLQSWRAAGPVSTRGFRLGSNLVTYQPAAWHHRCH
jgi:hypothetical protein